MNIKQKLSKKGMAGQMALVIIGLLLAAVALAVMMGGTKEIMEFLLQLIIPHPNPDPTDTASFASFDRLNDEIKLLLEEGAKKYAHDYQSKDFPYTLGGDFTNEHTKKLNIDWYYLIGFNADEDANQCILDSAHNSMKVPDKCSSSGRSCLCLCSEIEGCLPENCVLYKDIDYFISDGDVNLQEGKVIPGVEDPVTFQDVNCLVFRGGIATNRWTSKNLHVEIIYREKTYAYISQSSAATLARDQRKDCAEYDNEYDCADGRDDFGNSCVPSYNVINAFKECIICPDDENLDYYDNDWLIIEDPCEYKPEPAAKDVCSSYHNQYECAYGEDAVGNSCVPSITLSCLDCPDDCGPEHYFEDWLIVLDPCECWDDVAARNDCSDYSNKKFSCAIGRDQYGNNCVPGILGSCMTCPDECELDNYLNDWLKVMNPCDCVNSLE